GELGRKHALHIARPAAAGREHHRHAGAQFLIGDAAAIDDQRGHRSTLNAGTISSMTARKWRLRNRAPISTVRANAGPDPMSSMHNRATNLAIALALAALASVGASAQPSYPDHAVRIIVPHPAGGSSDSVTRIVAERMQAIWGKPVVLDNVVGAAGMLATTQGAKAAPDGYTMTTIVGTTTTLLASLRSKM